MAANDICILSNRFSKQIAQNIKASNCIVNYQDSFDYEITMEQLKNKFKTFIVIANFAINNELISIQQLAIDNKINLYIISFDNFKYKHIDNKGIKHLDFDNNNQPNMFNILNQQLNEVMPNE